MPAATLLLRLELTDSLDEPGGFAAHIVATIHQHPGAVTAQPGNSIPRKGIFLDLVSLARSLVTPGPHYILNCGCGVPECARLRRPIEVTHEGANILWRVPGGDAGYEVPATTFVFDRAEQVAEIARITNLLRRPRVTSITCHTHADFDRILAGVEKAIPVSRTNTG